MASSLALNQAVKSAIASLEPRERETNIYRPRVAAFLTLPVAGSSREIEQQGDTTETIKLPVKVRKCHLEFNDFNLADTARVELEYMDVGLDPRILRNAVIEIHMADVSANEQWTATDGNCRFIGIMVRSERGGSEDDGLVLDCEFHDYTTLFLQNTHYPPSADPLFSQSLSEIWAQLCDNTGPRGEDGVVKSTCEELRENIKFEGEASDIQLGEAVAERFRKFGKFTRKFPEMDAWAIWQRCCDMLGLITFIRLDSVIVTTSRSYYSEQKPIKFVWGKNILSIREQRNTYYESKGIAVSSYDSLTNQTLEAFYPPVGDSRVFVKHVNAIARGKSGASDIGGTVVKPAKKKGNKASASTKASNYDRFVYPGVTNPARLKEIAERIYHERSRQELEGTLTTVEMVVDEQDMLSLQAGDVISVGFDPEARTLLKSLGSKNTQMDYLVERGYSPNIADFISSNLQSIDSWDCSFFVKRVEIDLDASENSGSWQASVSYCNRINIEGSTQPAEEKNDNNSASENINARSQRGDRTGSRGQE